jgi:hypothetical protein
MAALADCCSLRCSASRRSGVDGVPKVGEPAPDWSAFDQDGRHR